MNTLLLDKYLMSISEQADNKYFGIELTREQADEIETEISKSEVLLFYN